MRLSSLIKQTWLGVRYMLVRNPSIVILSLDGPMGLVGAPGSLVNHNPDQSHFRLHSNWTAISGFEVPVQFLGFGSIRNSIVGK
jgi:hypothetical protein